MQLLVDNTGRTKIVETAELSGDFTNDLIRGSRARALAQPISGKTRAAMMNAGMGGYNGWLDSVSSFVNKTADIAQNVGQIVGIVNQEEEVEVVAAPAPVNPPATRSVTPQVITAGAVAGAVAPSFMTQYKTPLMIGGGLVGGLVLLKVLKVI